MDTHTAATGRGKPRPDRAPILNRVEDACARMGVSRSYFYRQWITPGRVAVVKLGTRTLIEESELQRVAAEIIREARRDATGQKVAA